MSYYRPSFSQTVAMTRGRGYASSYRGNSMRSSWGGGDRGRGNYSSSSRGGRFSSYSNPMDSRSRYHGPSERYSGSSRGYDEYKPYRPDMSSGYGRESQRTPERKRLRPEAPSSHRSHEGDGFNSSGSRYQSNSFSEHRSFSRDRRPPSYSASRDDFRRPSRSIPSSTPRGGYRGRISSRGLRGARLRELPPRRRLVESSYAIRKRLIPRVPSDYTRRLKITRLRSAISRRVAVRKRDLSDKEGSEEKEKQPENEVSDENKKDAENEGDDEEKEVKEAVADSENKESPQKSPKKESEKVDEADKPHRKEFIKLICPHCNSSCLTFSKYIAHLHSSRHISAMRHVALKQKSVLARMRFTQRCAQRELEESTDDLAPRTNFCPLCKLNYKQPKATHQASDSHKNMKKFLMPYCRVCRITFKSPMLYETHICSIEHIKRKARTTEINGEKSDKEEKSANEEDNLENFMTIDSVGDVDDEEVAKKKEEGEPKPKEKINVGIEQISKIEVHYCELCRMYLPRADEKELEKTLAKHCKQRTHMQRYIRYKEDKAIASRAERLQRKETAEKEREKKKLKEEKTDDEANLKEVKTEEKEKQSGDDDEAMEDKLWADDVNKDLGDILAEAESGNKTSDEEADAEGQRYDSKKNGDKKKDNIKDEAAIGVKIKSENIKEEAK